MKFVWEECPYQQRRRRLAQPCQHPRTEEQLIVLPPDRTDVQGSIQDTAATEANYVADNENRPRWYSVKSYSYGTTTPTTRLQLVIY